MVRRGLLLFPKPGDSYREDFAVIVDHVRRVAPELQVKVAHEAEPPEDFAAEFRGLPTLVVSFRHAVPVPVPGRVFCCRYIPKPRQLRRYAQAGVPFPPARMFHWGLKLDPAIWGPFVVMKPIKPGTMSHGTVHLIPTSLLHRLKPQHFAPRHPIHDGPMLLQRFVDTGERPIHYRVLTLFGEPLYAMSIMLKQPRPPLSAPVNHLLAAQIASNAGPRDRIMIAEPEILEFARAMSRALPDVPLQGLDIIREKATGRVFALESNPGGNTWHFSSEFAVKMREEMGDGRNILLNQFNALERAAKVLARQVELYAKQGP